MLTANTITNYENVHFKQDQELPYLLNIIQIDSWGYESKIGRFNFYTKEGFLLLLNGKRKEYSRFQPLLNSFFKYKEYFSWNSKVVEDAKKSGNDLIKSEKKELDKKYKEEQTNKAVEFLTKVTNKDETTINGLQTFKDKSDNELVIIINNTFKNVIPTQLVNDILNAIKEVFTPVIEVEEVITVNENNQTIDNEESFIVGNRNFSDYSTALQYCIESDFDPEIMIIKEAANIEPLETPISVETTQQPEIFNVYKNTFTTYSEAYNYCLKYITPVTMIISNKHETMTNERLQQLEHEYIFAKGNMSITDMKEYFQYISSLPISLDQDERYYKLKGYIQRYEYKQQQREEMERKQRKLFIRAGELLEDMKNNGLEVIEKYEHGISLVKYIYNSEVVHTTVTTGGTPIEKYHDMIENIYNIHFKQLITA
jgi:3-dehydroquinate dehydratase